MAIYGYCRISVDHGERSVSIETQKEAVRRYAAHRFPGEETILFADVGVSGGTSIFGRPEGQLLRQRLERGDHLVVAKLDRAFRSMADGAKTIQELTAEGVTLHFLDLGIDLSTPVGRVVAHVMIAFAELERSRIGERIRDGQRQRRSGGRPWNWIPPLGWRIVEANSSPTRRSAPSAASARSCTTSWATPTRRSSRSSAPTRRPAAAAAGRKAASAAR